MIDVNSIFQVAANCWPSDRDSEIIDRHIYKKNVITHYYIARKIINDFWLRSALCANTQGIF